MPDLPSWTCLLTYSTGCSMYTPIKNQKQLDCRVVGGMMRVILHSHSTPEELLFEEKRKMSRSNWNEHSTHSRTLSNQRRWGPLLRAHLWHKETAAARNPQKPTCSHDWFPDLKSSTSCCWLALRPAVRRDLTTRAASDKNLLSFRTHFSAAD